MPIYEPTATSEAPPERTEAAFITATRAEIDGYYVTLRQFSEMDMTDILMTLAAYSARASEIRSFIVRSEGRRAQSFRTREIEPFLEELDRQFRLWSRIQAVRDMEFRISGGAP